MTGTVTNSIPPQWNPQRGSAMPFHRYRPAHERVDVPLQDRTWPLKRITQAPLWVPVDLRDGNQALAEPMDAERKLRGFQLMVAMGFKEIEVGYPSASGLDFDFVRLLVKEGLVPDDVTVVVFTAARDDLIARTIEAIDGLDRAVVHMYTATAPVWRDVVLRQDRAGLKRLITGAAERVLHHTDRLATTRTRFEFSPEVFNLTEPEFVLDVCNAVTRVWDARPDRPVIHNLPATVEIATPNVYADQIEWTGRHLERRDDVILSIHPHNDRGTGVACAELAMLAGAQRVEGCLFGNGERTGNVDLVTLALNLYTQGVDPMLDLSDIDAVRRTVEYYNRMAVPPRHPYAGDLVHTAFSGTHQDAIAKGLAARTGDDEPWQVPYLPVDPADLGRSYEAVIRVNSQSGKGGAAYLLRTAHGLRLPEGMRAEFGREVQRASETAAHGGELSTDELWELFATQFMRERSEGPPVAAEVLHTERHAINQRPGTVAVYAHCRGEGWQAWGAGIAGDPERALAAAIAAAAARGTSAC